MPNAPTHDLITVVSGIVLGVPAYELLRNQVPEVAIAGTLIFVGAHGISGIMFSPDLDIDSAIDNRWGPFYWIWRPYMWCVPHRHFWSHSLVVAPLLKLIYFYAICLMLFLGGAWLLGLAGMIVPDYHMHATQLLLAAIVAHPAEALAFLAGFITGSAAHTIADWLVTGGKRFLRLFGIRITRDYRNHDRWRPRSRA
ncbi:MAG TPA: metal-binding protein [Roseiflexaceae bacterium]|nr:metal-binding protein [Roseiflexaceae bacterium]HMP38792.1 metal-binding protein [Roseiflexaceae bacterium]